MDFLRIVFLFVCFRSISNVCLLCVLGRLRSFLCMFSNCKFIVFVSFFFYLCRHYFGFAKYFIRNWMRMLFGSFIIWIISKYCADLSECSSKLFRIYLGSYRSCPFRAKCYYERTKSIKILKNVISFCCVCVNAELWLCTVLYCIVFCVCVLYGWIIEKKKKTIKTDSKTKIIERKKLCVIF